MNNSEFQAGWQIAVILGPKPQIISIPKDAFTFDFHGDHFEDVGLGYDNGFYDFLRNRTGAINGIRYFPSSDADEVLKEVAEGGDMMRSTEGNSPALQIFWESDHNFQPDASCDQYFGNNFIYRSKHLGKLAIGFAVDVLTPLERDLLKRRAME